MNKKLTLIVLVLVIALALSACGCKHENWNEATCELPKTCADCGETEGEALGHVWMAATCETAKTCETCGKTDGEAKGHAWEEATCETAKTCTACGLTEGEALGHAWEEATTDAPKTCTTCGLTEGEKIVTDPRFTTAATKELQGKWGVEIEGGAEELGLEGFEGTLAIRFVMEYCSDGTMKTYVELPDEAAFKDVMIDYLVETTYATMEAEGVFRDEADAAFKTAYGLTVPQYCEKVMETLDFATIFDSVNATGVYYVENGKIYTGMTWDAKMEEMEFTLEGDSLTLPEDITGQGGENTVLTRLPKEG